MIDQWWNSLAAVIVTYSKSLRSQPHFSFTCLQRDWAETYCS